jgi:hypothetical protein
VPYLRESVVSPDADVLTEYTTLIAVTRDGKKLTGVGNLDNFSIQLTTVDGDYHSFLREDVVSAAREFRSPMPAYGGLFTGSELDDLIAYLASLRGPEMKP